jgi:RND family efflux transporter MFP subunit
MSAQVDTQRVKFESETQKEIYKINLKKAEISFKKSQKKIESTIIVRDEELKINNIKIKQIKLDILSAENALKEFTLRAPKDGIIEYAKNYSTRKKIQVGDQVYPFYPIVSLPDLSRMKILTTVNETDINKIFKGQKVNVRLDAFPKKVYEGSVTNISNVSHKKEVNGNIKVFDVEVLLEKVESTLKPGMTVSCEFIIAELNDALFVDNPFIHKINGEYFVYKLTGNDIRQINVKLGPKNSKSVVIYGDIKAGDKIALYLISEET